MLIGTPLDSATREPTFGEPAGAGTFHAVAELAWLLH